MRPDVVYYWQAGDWHPVDPRTPWTVVKLLGVLARRGLVALRGAKSIGPPEGPPDPVRLREAAHSVRGDPSYEPCRLCSAQTQSRDPHGDPCCGGH